MNLPDWMPPLKFLPPTGLPHIGTTAAEQLIDWANAHALAAVEAYKKSLEPVAWAWCNANGRVLSALVEKQDWTDTPLYRLDDQP